MDTTRNDTAIADADGLRLPSPSPTTYFAPAGRDTPDEICRKTAVVNGDPMLRQALDAVPSMVMILNGHRQIVTANQAFLSLLGTVVGQVIEKRPGEAVGCVRAKEGPDGCGTARHCVTCGAVNAILKSQEENRKVVRECRILVETPSGVAPMDLRVTASAFRIGGDRFTAAAVEDISQSKRLALLQRTFFHDVLNSAGCIEGYAQYLRESLAGDKDVCDRLALLAGELIETISAQRDLFRAESGDLESDPQPISVPEILEEVRSQYLKHSVAEGRTIAMGEAWDGTVIADRRLVHRVLGNMVKNALEATRSGKTVTIHSFDRGGEVTFAVHNQEVMPEDVQLQIFYRSFSTKAQTGRGIGTYSMKLFGEQYLGGKVDFASHAPEGTTFTLTIPKKPLANKPPAA
jgi:signal transduction histidine kinase